MAKIVLGMLIQFKEFTAGEDVTAPGGRNYISEAPGEDQVVALSIISFASFEKRVVTLRCLYCLLYVEDAH